MKQQAKQRLQRLKFKIENNPIEKFQIVVYSDGNTPFGFKIIDENSNEIKTELSEIEGYYEREGKTEKVIYTQPSSRDTSLDINLELIKYDVILVIDTSYDIDIRVAFTSVLICTKFPTKDESIIYKQISEILEWDAKVVDKPENLMYAYVIENIRQHNIKNKQIPSIAVVIDSDLENIKFYNDKTKPIFDEYFLPDNFVLFYASSDVGSENLSNKLMKICDKEAKKALVGYRNELKATNKD